MLIIERYVISYEKQRKFEKLELYFIFFKFNEKGLNISGFHLQLLVFPFVYQFNSRIVIIAK